MSARVDSNRTNLYGSRFSGSSRVYRLSGSDLSDAKASFPANRTYRWGGSVMRSRAAFAVAVADQLSALTPRFLVVTR